MGEHDTPPEGRPEWLSGLEASDESDAESDIEADNSDNEKAALHFASSDCDWAEAMECRVDAARDAAVASIGWVDGHFVTETAVQCIKADTHELISAQREKMVEAMAQRFGQPVEEVSHNITCPTFTLLCLVV